MKWTDWLLAEASSAGREPVIVNLDETSVSYSFHGARGNVVKQAHWRSKYQPPTAHVGLSQRYGMITHVGMITNRGDCQSLLPQLIIGSRKKFTRKLLTGIGRVPSPVDLIKKDSAWNNTETMKSILSSLDGALRHIENKQVILIMDAAKCHISPKVLELAASLRIWVCIVPTDTTWLLQPLDVSVFSHYKRFLRNQFRDCLIDQGHVTDRDWLHMITTVATDFLQSSDWASAFNSLGLLGDRANISGTLQSHCPGVAISDPSDIQMPTVEDLKHVLPNRLNIPRLHNLLMARPHRRRLIIL